MEEKGNMRYHGLDMDAYLAGYPQTYLSKEEEQEIGKLPFRHKSRWKLIHHNMKFLADFSYQIFSKNKCSNDYGALLAVAQDTMINLAMTKFVSGYNARFVHYAALFMQRALAREVHRQSSVVKLPEFREKNRKVLREDADYNEYIDPGHSVFDIADPDRPSVEHQELCSALYTELRKRIPNPIHRYMLYMSFGLTGKPPMSYADIGERTGYSRQWVRKLIVGYKQSLKKSPLLREHHHAMVN